MIGKKLKALRLKEGLTQKQLGLIVGEEQHTISNYEKELRKINSEFLELISDKLGYKILFVKKGTENMRYGFLNIKEEEWEEIFSSYRGCIPNKNNSNYEDRLINSFVSFDEEEDINEIESYGQKMLETIKKGPFNHVISNIEHDIDKCNNICFFDMIITEDILLNEFKELLAYINTLF